MVSVTEPPAASVAVVRRVTNAPAGAVNDAVYRPAVLPGVTCASRQCLPAVEGNLQGGAGDRRVGGQLKMPDGQPDLLAAGCGGPGRAEPGHLVGQRHHRLHRAPPGQRRVGPGSGQARPWRRHRGGRVALRPPLPRRGARRGQDVVRARPPGRQREADPGRARAQPHRRDALARVPGRQPGAVLVDLVPLGELRGRIGRHEAALMTGRAVAERRDRRGQQVARPRRGRQLEAGGRASQIYRGRRVQRIPAPVLGDCLTRAVGARWPAAARPPACWQTRRTSSATVLTGRRSGTRPAGRAAAAAAGTS